MAGDWIKVEKCSPGKPELLKIARMLGVHQDHALGTLIRFWCWLDDNCVDGVVDGVVDADVDALLSCPGLSSLLTLVGWIEFDADPVQMRVVNFSKHNGDTSKNRALKSQRQAKWRDAHVDAHVDATPSTRKEKKRTTERETLTAPTEEHGRLARSLGVDCPVEWLKYLDHQKNAKNRHTDLRAGFNNWLRRAHDFAPAKRGAPFVAARGVVTNQIWKGVDDGPAERVIDGEVKRVA